MYLGFCVAIGALCWNYYDYRAMAAETLWNSGFAEMPPTLPFNSAIDRSQRYANGLSRATTLHDLEWLFALTADDLLNHAMLRPFSISKLMPRKCQVECADSLLDF